MKKIVFFGTPNFTIDFLELLKQENYQLVGVVTGQDKPVGRGMRMCSPVPKIWAEENDVTYFQPQKLDENLFLELQKLEPDLFIVIAYGKIIPEKFINLPRFGTINLHYSLLPKYRGASPVESTILNSEAETGITIQQMAYALDSGNILFQEKIKILETETATELRNKLNKRALEVFPKFLLHYFPPFKGGNEGGFLKSPPNLPFEGGGIEQDKSETTFCGKFSKQDFDVTKEYLEKDFLGLYKKYRAFDAKVFFMHNKNNQNIRVKITSMEKNEILKVLPESRKEISYLQFLETQTKSGEAKNIEE